MENRDKLYRQVGEALHLSQVLELQIHVLISILNDNFGTDLDQNGLILNEDKKTLGQLIKELKKRSSLDDAGSIALEQALDKRNYIAHEFYNRNVDAFSDEKSYKEAMERLVTDTKIIAFAAAMTQGFVGGFCEVLKIDLKDILIKQRI